MVVTSAVPALADVTSRVPTRSNDSTQGKVQAFACQGLSAWPCFLTKPKAGKPTANDLV
jgi:hypothetical protein